MTIKSRLKIMIFLQFFIWGSWLVTLGSYMINTLDFSGAQVGAIYGASGLASLIMPSLVGIIADRWVKANRLYGIFHFIGAIFLLGAAQVSDPTVMFWVMFFNAVFFVPTISLSYTISYIGLEKAGLNTTKEFPGVRVYGTVSFIFAMWLISLGGFELSNLQLYIAAGAAVLLALFSLVLPDCPTSNDTNDKSWTSRLGLDAFVLFKQKRMAVFFLFAMLIGAALQINLAFANPFLHDFALNPAYEESLTVKYPSILLSIGQFAEVIFILAIPFFLRKFGIKTVMLLSMAAWTLRFVLLGFGDPTGLGFILLLLSMIVYGVAFDFFNISGSMFVDKEVDRRIRGSAQGLFMTMVNGLGAYLGAVISGQVVDYLTVDGIKDWQSIWLVFAAYTLILGILFAVSFKSRKSPDTVEQANTVHSV
ncbi:nucleoside permease [Planococcus chinensis]|uniref:Nucleoside permease n=1 Tax=Planococcus chinensis TaxID=272917 RepID=A0ABW4QDD8_9BACL